MNYYQELTFSLRMRQLPEARIVDILQEVQDLSEQSGQSPQNQFGRASTYAESFPKGKTRSRAMKIAIAILGVATVIIGIDLAQAIVTDTPLHVGPVRVFFALLGIQIITVIAAFVAEHRLPAGFKTAKERRS